ncbi:MAG: hypothetical protein HY741_14270 [Chloroflexi bacterium]|nr:hypothetical protein [Chloroflexota bacterium]
MKWFKVLAVLALFALAVGAAPRVARADEPDYSNPAVVKALVADLAKSGNNAALRWSTLSPQGKLAVQNALTGVKLVRVEDGSNAHNVPESTTSCAWRQVGYEMYSAVGIKLWGYYQRIDWCYNGTVVTSKTRNRSVSVIAPFWSFTKHTGNLEQGGVNQSYYRAWTQGEFKFCVSSQGCIQYVYPWIDQTVRGNGTATGKAGQ